VVSFPLPISILDLAPIGQGQTPTESIAASVQLAQLAEELGYARVWYAEHHNMAGIASSATSVLIAHVGAHTSSIRLGAGGIMLPNHSPLTIAEQFGTLASMYPGRIDLGLGRAPGSDQRTMYALRRDPRAAETFPQDVVELQAYLRGDTRVPGVDAIPGKGTNVPLYILGSSLFGAQLAAALGLPYAFASHFAPAALHQALAVYRDQFKPSEQLDAPYLIVGVNVLGAESTQAAERSLLAIRRQRAVRLYSRAHGISPDSATDEDADELLSAGAAAHVDEMLRYRAVGTSPQIRAYLDEFVAQTGANELIVAHHSINTEERLRSVEILAEAMTGDTSASALRTA
jgi:luciferase family oxidoreductase group 1